MMKKTFFSLILFLLLCGCEPGYVVYIKNNSRDLIQIETEDPIESFIAIKEGRIYDSIIHKRLIVSDSHAVYVLKPDEKIKLYGHLGSLESAHFPFTKFVVYTKNDSLSINRENLMSLVHKLNKNHFVIHID